MSTDDRLRKATEMAHLLETHPDTTYSGDLYSDDLLLDRQETEERINELSPELMNDYSSGRQYTGLAREIREMVAEADRIQEPSEEQFERTYNTIFDKVAGYAQASADEVMSRFDI